LLLERTKLLAEGAGALPIAALLSRSEEIPGENVVAVISGGNADLTTLYRILMRGLMREGRIARITLSLKDVPGSLEKVLKILADLRCNILDILHDRFDLDIKPGYAKVKILMEVSSEQVIKTAITKLRDLGVEVLE
ncbi:MAG: ACT domain-containing protein, partial [Zestosphaera sp.]